MTEAELERRWQAGGARAPSVSLYYVRQRIESLERRARARDLFEYAGAVLGTALCVWAVFRFSDLWLRVGAVLTMAGGFVSLWTWIGHSKAGRRGSVDEVVDGLTAYRKELERQRNRLHDNWRWYIAPILPGTTVLLTAVALQGPANWITYAVIVAACVGWIVALIAANERSAADLQAEIDALNSLGS